MKNNIVIPLFILIFCVCLALLLRREALRSYDGVSINPTDIQIGDKTWWIKPQDDKQSRSLIFTFNDNVRYHLHASSDVKYMMSEIINGEIITWYTIVDTNLTGFQVLHQCNTTSHKDCDSTCTCDGMGCR